jgi:hypothetical protein
MLGGYPCTCEVEAWRFYTLTEPEPKQEGLMNEETGWDTGSMTVVVTFAGGETQTFNNVLIPTKGEPFAYKDGGTRVLFESADSRDPILYEVLNPLSIATTSE